MSAKLTPWFDGRVKPARPGVYERRFIGGEYYAQWTGLRWLCARSTAEKAAKELDVSIQQDTIRWRGLAQEPKA